MTSNRSSTSLRDALYALAMTESVPDADMLDELIRQHPEHGEYLTEFAAELALDALVEDKDAEAREAKIDLSRTSPAVEVAKRRFNDRRKALAQQASAETKLASLTEAVLPEDPHPAWVREAEKQIIGCEVTVEGLTEAENERVARYFEHQFARLMVKMRLAGKYRLAVEAIKD